MNTKGILRKDKYFAPEVNSITSKMRETQVKNSSDLSPNSKAIVTVGVNIENSNTYMFYNISFSFLEQAIKKLNFLSQRMVYEHIPALSVNDQVITTKLKQKHELPPMDTEPILTNYLRSTVDIDLQLELSNFNDEVKTENCNRKHQTYTTILYDF